MSLHPSVFIIILLVLVDIFDTEVMKRLYETWFQGRFRETTFEEKKVTEARGREATGDKTTRGRIF